MTSGEAPAGVSEKLRADLEAHRALVDSMAELLPAADDTARIQEMHILLIHLISEIVDEWADARTGD